MSMGLDTVRHHMFYDMGTEPRVRRATGDVTEGVHDPSDKDYPTLKGARNELRNQVVLRICTLLDIKYKMTEMARFYTDINDKLSLLADIYGSIIVPHIVEENDDVRFQVGEAVGGCRQLALEIVSLSGHTLDWFPTFGCDNEFVLAAGETSRLKVDGAMKLLGSMLDAYEEGLAVEDRERKVELAPKDDGILKNALNQMKSVWFPAVPSEGLTNLSHLINPTTFQLAHLERAELLVATAVLYKRIYPENKPCILMYNRIKEALYRPGAIGYLTPLQAFEDDLMTASQS